ncbi:glycosyltransferase [Novosphingobium sp. JCM 18896]|uniref:glycosyltransferase n=1 Tax=Novosphingobium sp. JCM 18896 TaxID=2989731 RepID=UPI002223C8D9|nr:glycosyltransferase [Novosphingobium sp. JCM 18896]MCW1428707.1 glycosyltransferase [Novosphingobium sp. JCM 18896]
MKIVDVCAFYSPHGGGVRTYVEQKLAIGPELGHEIVILAPGDEHTVIERGPMARIVTIPSPRLAFDRKYWYFGDEPALHAALDALEPDFVEVGSPWRSPSYVARWQGQVPRALVMHNDPFSVYAYRWLEPWLRRETIDRRIDFLWQHMRALGHDYDRVVCASRELRSRLARGGVAGTALHPMGVDTALFGPQRRDPAVRRQLLALCELPEDAHLLIGVGRFCAEKRWPVAIDAVMRASLTRPIGLVLLGEGGAAKRLTKHIAGNPHIRLLAPERDRARFATILASADALIHAGTSETFGMAPAEARASGVPVIVPDEGGAADHAEGGAGLTYRAGNALAAAEAILALLGQSQPPCTPHARSMRDHFAALFADYERIVQGERRVA